MRQSWPGYRQRSRTSRDGRIDMARGPRYVDFGAIHRDRQRRRDAKASGHLGNVGQDEFTADGLVKAAPRPPRRHTTSTFDNGMEAFQAVSTAQRKSDARKTSLSDLAIGGGEALSAVFRSPELRRKAIQDALNSPTSVLDDIGQAVRRGVAENSSFDLASIIRTKASLALLKPPEPEPEPEPVVKRRPSLERRRRARAFMKTVERRQSFEGDEEPATPREPKPMPVPAAAKRTGPRRPGFDGTAGIKTNMRRFARKFGTAKERQQAIADNARLNGTDARAYAVAGATG